jgi:hypothetical protein
MFDHRPYKFKNPSMKFFCPLCRVERAFMSTPRVSKFNYVQIALTSSMAVALTYERMGPYSLIFPFIIWAGVEMVRRWAFRGEIPCPHCGFDASWYQRDVKVARRLVHQFWDKNDSVQQPPPVKK